MPDTPSFEALLAQLRRSDDDAARAVYQRYFQRLIGLAGLRLRPHLQQKVGPEDVAQSVLKSVILRLGNGQFDIGDWDSLWGLLVRFTLHRCLRVAEFYHAAIRDVNREAKPRRSQADSGSRSGWQFLDREPSPDEAAILAETLEQVLDGFDERGRQIVALSLQGCDVREISTALDCTESKVYRVLARVRQVLERMNAGEE